jgi:tRNA pseudouridine55 synthase
VNAPRIPKRDVHGWLVLDKPVGTTSTTAVAILKRLTRAKKVGHAGTLDPLASGLLPIAFGEATKTVSYVMDGRKIYRFKVRWGIETDTDDTEGKAVATSETRPSRAAIEAALGAFTGTIEQTPPRFSAIKVGGERAYDLARAGEEVLLQARTVEIHRLDIVEQPDSDHTILEAECGKGTYVRAIARDLGRALGCYGHVCELRRTRAGSFEESNAISLDEVERLAQSSPDALTGALLPVASSLSAMPQVAVGPDDAQRILRGQAVLLRGRDAPVMDGTVTVSARGALIALADVEMGALKPKRIFHLPR